MNSHIPLAKQRESLLHKIAEHDEKSAGTLARAKQCSRERIEGRKIYQEKLSAIYPNLKVSKIGKEELPKLFREAVLQTKFGKYVLLTAKLRVEAQEIAAWHSGWKEPDIAFENKSKNRQFALESNWFCVESIVNGFFKADGKAVCFFYNIKQKSVELGSSKQAREQLLEWREKEYCNYDLLMEPPKYVSSMIRAALKYGEEAIERQSLTETMAKPPKNLAELEKQEEEQASVTQALADLPHLAKESFLEEAVTEMENLCAKFSAAYQAQKVFTGKDWDMKHNHGAWARECNAERVELTTQLQQIETAITNAASKRSALGLKPSNLAGAQRV